MTTKLKPIVLRPHEARRLAECGEVLVARKVKEELRMEESETTWELGNCMSTYPMEGSRRMRWFFLESDVANGRIDILRQRGRGDKPPTKRQALKAASRLGGYYRDKSTVKWSEQEVIHLCPFGQVGERRWVRETWSPDHRDFYPNFPFVYKADGMNYDIEDGKVFSPELNDYFRFQWRSPSVMPRHASRFTVESASIACRQPTAEDKATIAGVEDGVWYWLALWRVEG